MLAIERMAAGEHITRIANEIDEEDVIAPRIVRQPADLCRPPPVGVALGDEETEVVPAARLPPQRIAEAEPRRAPRRCFLVEENGIAEGDHGIMQHGRAGARTADDVNAPEAGVLEQKALALFFEPVYRPQME
ncbi:hypothetical protein HUU39_16020 [candidate division KSB1 bacterium]|nr:hypothetical protein [candidate division KSB1 bacterium]